VRDLLLLPPCVAPPRAGEKSCPTAHQGPSITITVVAGARRATRGFGGVEGREEGTGGKGDLEIREGEEEQEGGARP
jgi:hypothetical protein